MKRRHIQQPCSATCSRKKALRYSAINKFMAGRFVWGNLLKELLLPLLLVTTGYTQRVSSGPSTVSSEESQNVAFSSTVSEVRLLFLATDEHNHTVEDLRRNDFAVVDDERVIREFRSFIRSDAVYLNVVVLIDSSESVLPRFRQEITDVAQLISQSPWNPGDHVSVLAFGGSESEFICDGNCRESFSRNQIVPRGGATPLLDAIEIATTLLVQRRQPEVWPVILLFSDGDDTISKASLSQVREKILNSGEQIYSIDVSNSRQENNGSAMLRSLAEDSGGRYVRLSEGTKKIFSGVIDDLHSARLVTYQLPNSGSNFHSIRILPTHNLHLQFRCRRGYYNPTSGQHREDNP
jgi:VWFA-related protein